MWVGSESNHVGLNSPSEARGSWTPSSISNPLVTCWSSVSQRGSEGPEQPPSSDARCGCGSVLQRLDRHGAKLLWTSDLSFDVSVSRGSAASDVARASEDDEGSVGAPGPEKTLGTSLL